ncbi:hypothetical protein [Mycobacterium mantenii]|nr:hypothetical protein [Mycobacterium mantenii]
MANNRYLEVIKRLLGAEMYLRLRREAKEREPQRPAAEEKPK